MLLTICFLLFIIYVNGFTTPFSSLKKTNLKMVNENALISANTFISRGMVGLPWTYDDLVNNVNNKNVQSGSVLENINTIIALDKNYDDVITPDNLHSIKSIPHLTEKIIDLFTQNKISFNILTYDTRTILDYIPGPVQFFLVYILFVSFINFIRFRNGGGQGMGPGGGPMNFVNSMMNNDASIVNPEDIDVTFKDVAGCDEAKYELVEVVDFLKDSSRFDKAGAKIPRGVLLEGPPGTGKTLLARATAGEANVSFISASGSQFIEMFVGVGASRIRKLFETAEKNKPCIIFIDEIDAIGRQRGAGLAGGNDEREQTLNQLLTNMDGFSKSDGIIVMAATNRVDILDSALTRPGRFDRKVNVNLPDVVGRRKIMDVHFKDKNLSENIDLGAFAELTSGFSGADIANLANEAAILSIRYNETSINDKCLMDARKGNHIYI